jgi:dTDP-L-rhamnose 4-epimerase
MISVLITGGAGFIGRNLCTKLVSASCKIRILDPLTSQIHGEIPLGLEWLSHPSVEYLRGSVLDKDLLSKALADVDVVVHLAAETGTGQSMYQISNYNLVNSQGTASLLDTLANAKKRTVRRVILASSRSVYGEGAYACPICNHFSTRQYPPSRSLQQLVSHQWDPLCNICSGAMKPVATNEHDQIRPASIYAATKYAQEELVRITCESIAIDYAILRLQNVYGEGQSLNNPYTGILSIFSTRIRRGSVIPVFEDGQESRDFIHVDDVARAFLECVLTEKQINCIMNVGSGAPVSVLQVVDLLMASFGTNVPVEVTSLYRLGDIRHNFADISRLKSLMPEFPMISLAEGLSRFSSWVNTQPLPEDKLESAHNELRQRRLMP